METIAERIYNQLARTELPRHHLGCSMIGKECLRELWYSFRWCWESKIDGRLALIFSRGQDEESRVIRSLESIGCTVIATDKDGKQHSYLAHKGHCGGSIDGAVTGVPGHDGLLLLEIKTHNRKSFIPLTKKGVEATKPLHYAQMQAYMALARMDTALYFAVCKDNDEIYTEIVEFNSDFAENLFRRAGYVIDSATPPPRIADNPKTIGCRFCSYVDICHNAHAAAVNCRTCAHSSPVESSAWICELSGDLIDDQSGCPDHVFIPALVPANVLDANKDENWIEYEFDDRCIKNGTGHTSSHDLRTIINDRTKD